MAALDFPDSPTVGQVFDKWTWNGTMWVLTPGGAAGYVFVQDTTPVARKVGDTWFDTSTGATGGTSWVAIEEGAVGSEKVWVQTSPGAGAPPFTPSYIATTLLGGQLITATITRALFVADVHAIAAPAGDWTYDSTSHQFICNRTGVFQLGFHLPWGTNTANAATYIQAQIYHSSLGVVIEAIAQLGTPYGYSGGVRVMRMNSGDIISVLHSTTNTSGTATRATGNFWANRVGN